MGPGHQKTLCRTQALAWGTHRVRFSCEVSGEDGSGGTGPGRGCLSSSAPRDAAGQSSGNRSSLRGAGLAVTPSGQAEPCVLALVGRPYTQNMIDIDIARRLKHAGLRWEPTNGDVFTIDNEQLRDEAFMLSSMVIEAMIARNGNRLFRFNGTTEWALDSVEQHEALWIPREDQLRGPRGGVPRPASGRGCVRGQRRDRGRRSARGPCAPGRGRLRRRPPDPPDRRLSTPRAGNPVVSPPVASLPGHATPLPAPPVGPTSVPSSGATPVC